MNPKIYKWIIWACLYLVLATPLIITNNFLFPFITGKALFFRVLIEIALFFYVLLIISKPEYRPRFSKIHWAILIYLILMTFTSLFGVNPFRSFWSNIERAEGLLMLYHLFIFFIILAAVFRTKKDWFRYLNVSIIFSLILGVYALFQKLDASFVIDSGNRVSATLGNPTYVAACLIFHIFFALMFLFWKPDLKWRLYYGFVILFGLFVVLNTQTRGALVGLLVGFIVLGLLGAVFGSNRQKPHLNLPLTKGRRKGFSLFLRGRLRGGLASPARGERQEGLENIRKYFFFGLILLFILSGSLWLLRDQTWVRSLPGIGRMTQVSFDNTTVENRLMSWGSAIAAWQERPILGYGYENFNIAFNEHFNSEMFRDVGSVVWFDRAHNTLLDQLVYGGIFGPIAYLAIFAFAVWLLWLRKKQAKDFEGVFVPIVITSLLATYLVQNFFVFDCLASYVMFYITLAFIVFQDDRREFELSETSSEFNNNSSSKYRIPSVFTIVILILIFIFSIYFFNFRLIAPNQLAIKAMQFTNMGYYQKSLETFEKAGEEGTNGVFEIRQHLVQTAQKVISKKDADKSTKKKFCNLAISEIKKNIKFAPRDAYGYMFLANIYNTCSRFDPQRAQLAVNTAQEGLKHSPTRPQFYYQMSRAAMNVSNYQKSIEYAKQAIALNYDVKESHWRLLTAYVFADKKSQAETELDKMKQLRVKFAKTKNLNRLTQIYIAKKDYQKIESIIKNMINSRPKNAELYAQLAFVYKKMDNKEKMQEFIQKAANLDPKYSKYLNR